MKNDAERVVRMSAEDFRPISPELRLAFGSDYQTQQDVEVDTSALNKEQVALLEDTLVAAQVERIGGSEGAIVFKATLPQISAMSFVLELKGLDVQFKRYRPGGGEPQAAVNRNNGPKGGRGAQVAVHPPSSETVLALA